MNHLPVTLLPGQLSNLLKLSDYLLSGDLKANFDMSDFTDVAYGEGPLDVTYGEGPLDEDWTTWTTCGTVGCAAGHGPYAGIPKLPTEDWQDYTRRVFIESRSSNENNKAWDFCFSGSWARYDNTPEGAANRIKYLIVNGVPVNKYDVMDITIKY